METNTNYTQEAEIVNEAVQIIEEKERRESSAGLTKSVDNNFEITHREYIARAFELGGNPYGKIQAYIYRHVKLNCSLYFGSIEQTSEKTGISRSSTKRVFNALQENDLIRKYRNGVWAVNPKFMRRGTGGKYIGLISFYYSLPKKKVGE